MVKQALLIAAFFLIPLIAYFLVPSPPELSPATLTHIEGNAMGMDYHVMIGRPLSQQELVQTKSIILSIFDHIDKVYNGWNPHSEISVINRAPAKKPIPVSKELFAFLQTADTLNKKSQGKFDPTIEPLRQFWQHHFEKRSWPDPTELLSLKSKVGWEKIQLKQNYLIKMQPGIQLNFDCISKGYCVDLIVESLLAQNEKSCFVEWGGEIRAVGNHPKGRSWQVYVSNLGNNDPDEALVVIPVTNCALATSGDYFQRWNINNRIYTHILNPKSLEPLEIKPGSLASVTVQAASCHVADALATAAMLFDSLQEAEEWAKGLQENNPELVFWFVTR